MKTFRTLLATASTICALLGSVVGTAHGQTAPDPGNVPPTGAAPPSSLAQPAPAPPRYLPPPQSVPAYPGGPLAPASAVAPNGQFVAPLSQTTQGTYVPQSVALSGPRFLKDWTEGQPIPDGYHPETRVRKGLVISGALIGGIPYLYSALFASVGSDAARGGSNKAAALWVPVLGPFIEIAQTDSATVTYMLVLDGLAQATGAAMLIYGLAYPRALLVRNDLAMMTIVPSRLGRDGSGLSVIGRF